MSELEFSIVIGILIIDPPWGHNYSTTHVVANKNKAMSELDFKALELKVNQLIDVCKDLSDRNRQLKQENEEWRAERAKVIQQKDAARAKVEAMILRLKAMEQ